MRHEDNLELAMGGHMQLDDTSGRYQSVTYGTGWAQGGACDPTLKLKEI